MMEVMVLPAPLAGGSLLDPTGLLSGFGPWALVILFAIIFIESGLLFPFLPGDSLLFAAGTLHLVIGVPIPVLVGVAFAAAFLGDQVGYWLGNRFGRQFFSPDARILKTKYLEQAEAFFDKYGGRAIVLARFVPVVRTYVPLVAGMARHSYRHFVGWNILGGALWVGILVTAGVLLGHVPVVANNIELITVAIIAVSVAPMLVTVIRKTIAGRRASAA